MENGLRVARFLENHPMVLKVLHPGKFFPQNSPLTPIRKKNVEIIILIKIC